MSASTPTPPDAATPMGKVAGRYSAPPTPPIPPEPERRGTGSRRDRWEPASRSPWPRQPGAQLSRIRSIPPSPTCRGHTNPVRERLVLDRIARPRARAVQRLGHLHVAGSLEDRGRAEVVSGASGVIEDALPVVGDDRLPAGHERRATETRLVRIHGEAERRIFDGPAPRADERRPALMSRAASHRSKMRSRISCGVLGSSEDLGEWRRGDAGSCERSAPRTCAIPCPARSRCTASSASPKRTP